MVDNQVGRILEALDASGQSNETIVIFTSDHGDMMGDHNQVGKHVPYEESVRIPLLIRDPRLGFDQRRVSGRFSQIDLVPTLLELLEQQPPDDLHGRSRAAAVRGDGTLERVDTFIEWNDSERNMPGSGLNADPVSQAIESAPRRTVIGHEGWKLNLYEADDHELYDLNADPHEQVNVIEDPAWRERASELRQRIVRWQELTLDPIELPPLGRVQ